MTKCLWWIAVSIAVFFQLIHAGLNNNIPAPIITKTFIIPYSTLYCKVNNLRIRCLNMNIFYSKYTMCKQCVIEC